MKLSPSECLTDLRTLSAENEAAAAVHVLNDDLRRQINDFFIWLDILYIYEFPTPWCAV